MSLEKACIRVLLACNAGGVSFEKDEKIFAQFNPAQYSLSANIKYTFKPNQGKLCAQYLGEDQRTLDVELFFDMISAQAVYEDENSKGSGNALDFEEQMDAASAVSTAYVNRIMALTRPTDETGAPPMVEFLWGGESESLKGVISSAALEYVLFNSKGEPTRANLKLTFNACDDIRHSSKDKEVKLDERYYGKKSSAGFLQELQEIMEAVQELELTSDSMSPSALK